MSYRPLTRPEAKYEALLAAVQSLKTHPFRPDEREFPRESDQKKLSAAYLEVVADLEKLAARKGASIKKGTPV